ncbi:type II toxin-antitoxin system HipA family toxin [Actinomyces bowdenii]|uniref:HipA domain-containing protein n=1 Tax=Actinomyces bowdenii TaxID=131109 RepID=A0A853EPG2_9ACTO|nr:HipA domain-containing protein [Actinomyces bowdenii]MBF0698069.1 HipA domain-containing protein [Actinomyces bowdenii]NYS70242.1 HipA domain-containing protein [Actinomyces bowdenii]
MKETSYAVRLHGEHVGSLRRRDNFTKFVIDRDYWDRPGRPVLGRWFEEHPRKNQRAVDRVPAWFSNLLPEGRLRELIARGQGVNVHREIDLLERIGSDLPGAVEVGLEAETMVDRGFDDAVESSPGARPAPGIRRASLAGMTMKFSVRRDGDRLVMPAHDQDGDWILKTPDSAYPGLPANEYAVMNLARAVGITVPDTQLWERGSIDDLGEGAWPSQETLAYAVRRFDRSSAGRVHIEDFAQLLGRFGVGEGKYRSNVETIAGLAYRGYDDASLQEMVRRTVFNLLIGNNDAHLKNWSLIYPDRRKAELSPAYDLVCTSVYLPQPEDPHLGLPFLGAKRLSEVRREHFSRLQDTLEVRGRDVLAVVDDTVERFADHWADEREALPPEVSRWVEEHLQQTRAQLRE